MFWPFRKKKIESYPPPLALDELAAAFHLATARTRSRPLVRSLKLTAQFPAEVDPAAWERLADALDCHLPRLVPGQYARWLFPGDWDTIVDVLEHAAAHHPEWQLPAEVTVQDWVRSQIFAVVRKCFVDQLHVPPEAVHRNASIVNDLIGRDF